MQNNYRLLQSEETHTAVTVNEGDQKEAERRLVRIFDLKLLPFLSLMYIFSSLDRSTLGNAVLDNFEEDIGMSRDQFNGCVAIFYAGFLAFQIPSNIMLQRLTARRWLPLLMVSWGIVACCHAAVKNYAGLMALRFFLGFFEAGFFPGVLYFLTQFYKKDEMATRIALFWGSSVVAHAFAGVLAYGILQMRGVGGMTGWQWLFLVEGIPTVLMAVAAWFYLPASASTWNKLTPEQRLLAVKRLYADAPQGRGHLTLGDLDATNRQQALEAFRDWKVWLWMVMFFCGSVPNTSVSNFLPMIVKGMGYDDKLSANLMSAPPYLMAVVVMLFLAYSSDRHKDRAFHAVVGALVCLTGYALLCVLTTREALYASVCIAVAGIFVINPIVNAWLTSNIAPDMKKSVATAMAVSANNSAGLVGSNIYRASDAPLYVRGHTINLCFLVVFVMLVLVHRYLLKRANRMKNAEIKRREAEGEDAEQEQDAAGDTCLHFQYRL